MPPTHTGSFRFLLPSSLSAEARGRSPELEALLTRELGMQAEVAMAQDYRGMTADLLGARADAAWAPPYVCAQLEAMGARVLCRVVRRWGSSYRAALLCRADAPLTLAELPGKRAVWVDRDSVGGYLLALSHLRSKGLEPARTFASEAFAGSYRAAVQAVLSGSADVTSVYAPPGPPEARATGLADIVPEAGQQLHVLAFTDEAPNDGVALSMALAPRVTDALQQALLGLDARTEGRVLLHELFSGERFEPAPRLGYRALYRVGSSTP